MGTRSLTVVIVDNTPVIAQYGQWDGYPSGQGGAVLTFCRKNLRTQKDRAAFSWKAARCRWKNGTEVNAFLMSIGCKDGWMNMEQAAKFNAAFPYMNRDIGGKILGVVNDASADSEIILTNSFSFGEGGLLCEFAYVVDLTAAVLEAYVGGLKTPPPEGERFAGKGVSANGYSPVHLAGKWDLNKPPTQRTFERVIEEFSEQKRPW